MRAYMNDEPLVQLMRKYDRPGSYYTSYPVEARWSTRFSPAEYAAALERLAAAGSPLSLYVHFPFCPKQCYYCFCRATITRDRSKIREFLDHLAREVELVGSLLRRGGRSPTFKEVHFGGGSPSFMTPEEFDRLREILRAIVDFSDVVEATMEIDFRTVDEAGLCGFLDRGVNRISFGIQDFNPDVQKAVNREQPVAGLEKLLAPRVRERIKSVNFDLIYGLPRQTRESFRQTVETAVRLSPDRICVYNYNHRPDVNRHQSFIRAAELPDPEEKSLMFVDSVGCLAEAGYEMIGIDHFALAGDALCQAKHRRALGRNFNGYSVGRARELIGIGPTGSSRFGTCYAQNVRDLAEYYRRVTAGELPVARGYMLSPDDQIRRDVIDDLICHHHLDFPAIEQRHGICFRTHFQRELASLDEFVRDGIAVRRDESIEITPLGRLFVRHVCAAFDGFLQQVQ